MNSATELGLGEAEAIFLAKELNAELLLLDEKIPRELAKSLGLKVAGTLALIHAVCSVVCSRANSRVHSAAQRQSQLDELLHALRRVCQVHVKSIWNFDHELTHASHLYHDRNISKG